MKVLFCYQNLNKELETRINEYFKSNSEIRVKYFQVLNVYEKLDIKNINDQNKVITKLVDDIDLVVWEGTEGNDLLMPIIESTKNKKPLFILQGLNKKIKLIKKPDKNWSTFQIQYIDKEIKTALSSVVKIGAEHIQRKLIFIIPSEINNYLEWCKTHRKCFKANVIRFALNDVIKMDTEYSKYLIMNEKRI